jgi:hypothetical protein
MEKPLKSLKVKLKCVAFAFALAQAVLVCAHASPQRLSDQELSDVVGQAFINMSTFTQNGIDYSRVNFGGQIDVQFNLKNVKLGQYPRSYGAGNYLSDADLDFSNLALGTVNDATGAVTPFSIRNPFIEFAYQNKKVVGVRLGLGEAHGVFSGDLSSFSGNFNFRMQGTGQDLVNAACTSSFLACIGTFLVIDRNALYGADGQTVNFDHNKGGVGSVRANYVGLPNGTKMQRINSDGSTFAAPVLAIFSANGCSFVDMAVCFPNTQFQSFQLGSAISPAKDIFVSLQSQAVAWVDSKQRTMNTNPGVFFNIPKSVNAYGVEVPPITINFAEKNGIPRQNTCFGPLTKGC